MIPQSGHRFSVKIMLEQKKPAIDATARIESIYRYPVKGLSPEALDKTELSVGEPLVADRRYAIENGPIGFDARAPAYYPKSRFLMLMRNERLAALRTHFDDATNILEIRYNDAEAARGDLETAAGRNSIERFFAENFSSELKGPPKILSAPGHSFSDVAAKVVSIINLASVAAIEDVLGQPVDPLRFRGNLYVSGWLAWHEFSLIGHELAIGDTRLRVVKTTERCAATNVDPVTAQRDMNIPQTLMRNFGHNDCGVYAEVVAGGSVATGDVMRVTT